MSAWDDSDCVLFDRGGRIVRGAVRKVTGRLHTVRHFREDLTQEGFVALTNAVRLFAYDTGVPFDKYAAPAIYRAVWRLALRLTRIASGYSRRRQTGRLDDARHLSKERLAFLESTENPEYAVAAAELMLVVNRQLSAIHGRFASDFIAMEFGETSGVDVAASHGVSRQAINQRVGRVRRDFERIASAIREEAA